METGAFESQVRTSENTWLGRDRSPMIETLFRRASDVLQVPESLLHSTENAEDMQIVHYNIGQKYDAHHDWGVSGYPESRYITLLLYLNDMPSNNKAGGETAFPKAKNKNGEEVGMKLHPGRNHAVLFYNLLEDGNGDDRALHTALPVRQGGKWLANFWVWDPKRK
jgi:prolyl 4-hydroxylase